MHDDEIKPIAQLIRDYIEGRVPNTEFDDLLKFLNSTENKWIVCTICENKGFYFKDSGTGSYVKACTCQLGQKYERLYP